jgi:hypothetical protein
LFRKIEITNYLLSPSENHLIKLDPVIGLSGDLMRTACEWDGLLEDCADYICRNLVSKQSGNQFAFALSNQTIDKSHRVVDEKLARRVVYATGCSEQEAQFFRQLKERVEDIDQKVEVVISHGTDCRHMHTDSCRHNSQKHAMHSKEQKYTWGSRTREYALGSQDYASGSQDYALGNTPHDCDHTCDYNCTYPVIIVISNLFDQEDRDQGDRDRDQDEDQQQEDQDPDRDDPVLVQDDQDPDDRDRDDRDDLLESDRWGDRDDPIESDQQDDPLDSDQLGNRGDDADPEWASMTEYEQRLMREEEDEYALVAARKAWTLG